MSKTNDQFSEMAPRYDEIAPEMGFREYWYPVCLSKEVGEKPLAMKLMGDPVMFVRRNGKLYALADECPHRGTRLSLGSCQFPGTNTITCAYHGWTFDVTNGKCVAALTDGPNSAVINKVSARTYSTTECQGIVWIWMGRQQPVAPEEDIPPLFRQAIQVKVVRRMAYGNWRWHIENPGLGHALMLHRSSLYMRVRTYPGFPRNVEPRLTDEGGDGTWLCEYCNDVGMTADYPGLGSWPKPAFAQGLVHEEMGPLHGVVAKVSLRLPGITRVTHFPLNGAMYYEWFVQTDASHYIYFQVCCGYAKTMAERASFLSRFYLWGRFSGMVRFNMQDLAMVANSQDFATRHGGWLGPTRLYGPDKFQFAWRDYALRNARDLANRPAASFPVAGTAAAG